MGGRKIVDVANPAAPFEAGAYVTDPVSVWAIDVAGNYAYLAGLEVGMLFIIDVSVPTAPVLTSSYTPEEPSCLYGVAVDGSHAYLGIDRAWPGLASHALAVIDISNPSTPVPLARLDLPDKAWRISLAGHFAYVSTRGRGLQIVDITLPTAPEGRGVIEPFGLVQMIAIHDTQAILSEYKWGSLGYAAVRLVDLADPSSPKTLAIFREDWNPWDRSVPYAATQDRCQA